MAKKYIFSFLCIVFFTFPPDTAAQAQERLFPKGDVNHSENIDLEDMIVTLKILSNIPVESVFTGADANGDGVIGMEEAVYIMQILAGLRTPEVMIFDFDFSENFQGWNYGFADYPPGEEDYYELISEWREAPEPVREELDDIGSIFISGVNHSDDLFMYLKKRIEGLKPETRYMLFFKTEFATNAPTGCIGVGGAPGEAVWMKAGGSVVEPLTEGYYLNLDKGNQALGGEDARVIGNIANTQTDCLNPVFEIKRLDNETDPFEITTDAEGAIWVIVGTDSGFEYKTMLYYTHIKILVEEQFE